MDRTMYLLALIGVAGSLLLGLFADNGSLLPALLFWAAIGQGIFALVATGETTKARWTAPLRGTLLRLHPLLLLFPFAFLVYARDLSFYAWSAHPTGWLDPLFFTIRNALLLLAVWGLAARYAHAALRGLPARRTWAVLYLFGFVFSQTIIAFDWVMSFEYPWISTLFGGYFFVEALYAGVAIAAVTASILLRRRAGEVRASLRDAATLLFGFSLLWAGQFFAQYLVIWYGNLPQEVAFLARRVIDSPLRQLSTLVLGCLFIVPFVVLLSRSAKTMPAVVIAMAVVVLIGILIERVVFLLPVLALEPAIAIAEFLLLTAVFGLGYRAALRRPAAEAPAA